MLPFAFTTLLSSKPATPSEPEYFALQKKKKNRGNEGKKTIKRLSPRPKCYCFSHSRAFRIQKCFLSAKHASRHYFPVFHGPSTLKSISPAL